MLDWIFEGIANWVASVMTQIMDAISGVFLDALGTDMTAMEEYFPFAVSAYTVIQYTAWAVLFLVVVWQLFRAFSGPLSETEEPPPNVTGLPRPRTRKSWRSGARTEPAPRSR